MKIDRGFNLYVDITSACNASCPFCIAPTVGRADGPRFADGLRYGLDFTQKHSGSVQVTGGEPSLSRRLPSVLEEIGKRSFHRMVFNSNGCGITEELVQNLVSAGTTHVNLSRHHYDEKRNQEIMRIHPEKWSTDERFLSAVKMIHNAGIPVRVNCNLLAGYIDSSDEMSRFSQWGESFGVQSVAFSETFPLGVFDHQIPIEIGYAERMAVDLPSITKHLDSQYSSSCETKAACMSMWGQSNWISSFLVGGHRRFWNTPHGGEISVKTLGGWNLDGSPRPPTYSKETDQELRDGELYFAVVHPDGVVSASWDKRERILFEPQDNLLPILMERSCLDFSYWPLR